MAKKGNEIERTKRILGKRFKLSDQEIEMLCKTLKSLIIRITDTQISPNQL
jgi:uncharacterized tellurite resistance protein B-like protein